MSDPEPLIPEELPPEDPRPWPHCTYDGCTEPVAFVSENGGMFICASHFQSDPANPAPWKVVGG